MFRLPVDDRTALVLLEERHAEPLYEAIAANRPHLARWLPWAAEATPESTRAFVRASLHAFSQGNGYQCAIVHDGRFVGGIGTHDVDRVNQRTSIGYWLAEGLQGRGIMTASCATFLDMLFLQQGLHRVELRAAVENTRSRGVAERLGFRVEGLARQSERMGERWLDLMVYSILAPEWRALRQPPAPTQGGGAR